MPPCASKDSAKASQRRHEADAVHADPGRKGRQRSVDMRVAAGAPGEAGEPACCAPVRPAATGMAKSSARKTRPPPRSMARTAAQAARVVAWPGAPASASTATAASGAAQPAVHVHRNEQPPEGAGEPGGGEQPSRAARRAPWLRPRRWTQRRPAPPATAAAATTAAGRSRARRWTAACASAAPARKRAAAPVGVQGAQAVRSSSAGAARP